MHTKRIDAAFEDLRDEKSEDDAERSTFGLENARRLNLLGWTVPDLNSYLHQRRIIAD